MSMCSGWNDGYLVLAVPLVCMWSCGTTHDPESGDVDPVQLTITSPVDGAAFTTGSLVASGYLVARVPVTIDVIGSPARITLSRAGKVVGTVDENGQGTVELSDPGDAALVAVAYDVDDKPVSSDQVSISVSLPQLETCKDWLKLYQIDFTAGPETRGVPDPVTVKMPIVGVPYRYVSNTKPRTTMLADCSLILSLAKAAPILREHNVAEVADIGIYNYRCIGGGQPPGCTLSQHAQAKAIDIAGVTDKDGTYFNVTTDWIIDAAPTKTCDASTEPGKDTYLHQLICALKAAKVWNIVLTPNYNGDHRDHFHVDLTAGADTIRRVGPAPQPSLVRSMLGPSSGPSSEDSLPIGDD
jgi:hypothetical protein